MSYSSETFCCNHDDSDGLSHVLTVSRRRLQWNIDQLGCDCIDICAVVLCVQNSLSGYVQVCLWISEIWTDFTSPCVCLDDGFETYSNGILIHGSARRFLYVSLRSMSLMAQSYLSLTSSPSIRGIGDTWPHLFLNILGPSCFLYGRHPAAAPINNSWILSVYGKYLLQICLRMHLDILFVD